nr:uncharacterized protein LOC113719842 isoform X2 [Coffea arabica]
MYCQPSCQELRMERLTKIFLYGIEKFIKLPADFKGNRRWKHRKHVQSQTMDPNTLPGELGEIFKTWRGLSASVRNLRGGFPFPRSRSRYNRHRHRRRRLLLLLYPGKSTQPKKI